MDRTRGSDDLQRRSGSVLVEEGDEDVREVSVAMLESLGYRVAVAGNAEEALDILRRSDRVDLLFTDLVMPGGTLGMALARQAQLIRRDLRVLLTTGYSGLETFGAEEFSMIQKPFRPADLGRVVAQILATK